jgi:hypothetical protein
VYTFETLPLCDQWDEPVPHRFLRCAAPTDHAALLLPGADVAFLHPALYYSVLACMRVEADILWVGYGARPQFLSHAWADQAIQAKRDTVDAYRALLAQRPYQHLTLIGKSLGTLAMGHLLTTVRMTLPTRVIWLTPLFQEQNCAHSSARSARPPCSSLGRKTRSTIRSMCARCGTLTLGRVRRSSLTAPITGWRSAQGAARMARIC